MLKIGLILYTFSTPPFLCILRRFNRIVCRNIRRYLVTHFGGFNDLFLLLLFKLSFLGETLLLLLFLGRPLNFDRQFLRCLRGCLVFQLKELRFFSIFLILKEHVTIFFEFHGTFSLKTLLNAYIF